MSKTCDVLVVGSGIAGLVAALMAAREGCRVRLITDGMGSLAISSGYVDVLGYADGQAVTNPWQGLSLLDARHPYKLMGRETVQAALADFGQLMQAAGWPLHTGTDATGAPCNTLVPTIMGTLKPSYFLPAALDPDALRKAKNILVVSVQGLRDCRPALVISQLQRYKSMAGKTFSQLVLPSPLTDSHRSISTLDLARFMERAGGRHWLCAALEARRGTADLVLLPPVCGCHADAQTWQVVEEAAACPIMEMLSIPPAVGGLRLRDALLTALFKLDFDLVENARVCGAHTQEGQCSSVMVRAAGQEQEHRARAFVLATGGILGGGIGLEPGKATECVMGLDIPVPQDVSLWSEADIFGKHIFSHLGVSVNARMQAVDAAENPLWGNVFFAGRTVGHYDFAAEKSGHGVAISTGWQAGQMAARTARGEQL